MITRRNILNYRQAVVKIVCLIPATPISLWAQSSRPAADAGSTTQPAACMVVGSNDENQLIDPPPWHRAAPAPKVGSIYGQVTDSSGASVPNAVVMAVPRYGYFSGKSPDKPPDAFTDSNGYYSIPIDQPDLRLSDWSIAAEARDYIFKNDQGPYLQLPAEGCHLRRDLILEHDSTVRVTVKDEDGKALAGVSVGAERHGLNAFGYPFHERGKETVTNSKGQAEMILPVRRTPWTICAFVWGKAPAQADAVVRSEADHPELDLVLRQPETYDGLAVCADGGFPRGWSVWLQPIGNPAGNLQCLVDKRGQFTAENAGPGRYLVAIVRGQSWQTIGTVTLQPELDRINIHVPGPAPGAWTPFSIKVDAPEGWQSASYIHVSARSTVPYGGDYGTGWQDKVAKDATAIDMKRVPAGTYDVVANISGYATEEQDNIQVPGPQPVFHFRKGDAQSAMTRSPVLRVHDKATGLPIHDFLYRSFYPGSDFRSWTQVNTPTGETPLNNFDRHMEIEVCANGYATGWNRQLVLDSIQPQPVAEVELTSGASVSGKLVDSTGNPLANAAIFAKSNRPTFPVDHLGISRWEYPCGLTDDKGEFHINHLPPGDDQLILAHLTKGLAKEMNVHFTEGETKNLGEISVGKSEQPICDELTNRD